MEVWQNMKRVFFISCVGFVFFASVLFAQNNEQQVENSKNSRIVNGHKKTVITSEGSVGAKSNSGYYSEYAESVFFPEEPNQQGSN